MEFGVYYLISPDPPNVSHSDASLERGATREKQGTEIITGMLHSGPRRPGRMHDIAIGSVAWPRHHLAWLFLFRSVFLDLIRVPSPSSGFAAKQSIGVHPQGVRLLFYILHGDLAT